MSASSLVLVATVCSATWNSLGKKRAALLWPLMIAVGTVGVGTIAGAAVSAAGVTTPALQIGQATRLPLIPPAIACCGLTTAVVCPTVLYHVLAVDKEPGDTGGFPGFVEPADPTGTRGKPRPTPSAAPRGAVAMRY